MKLLGIEVKTNEDFPKGTILIVPPMRTLETLEEYWQRLQTQAVLVKNIRV